MADEGTTDTFEYPVNGRVLVLRKMTPGRVAMLERYWDTMQKRAEATDDPAEVVALYKKAADAAWGLVESQFIDPDDLAFVQEEILMGRLGENALGPIMANGETRQVIEDDADPAPAKKPGRKAPAKKAAKKAAPTTRAKR